MYLEIFKEILEEAIDVGFFRNSVVPETPAHGLEYGNRPTSDTFRQVTHDDPSGANFDGEHIFVSESGFIIYKVKNFANPDLSGVMSLFGNTKELRRAIDTVNGAARRGGKPLKWRTISDKKQEKIVKRSKYQSYTFWEFSFDGGNQWFILKPNPVQSIKPSKFVKKT